MKLPGYQEIDKKIMSVTRGKGLECSDEFQLNQVYFTCAEVIFLLKENDHLKQKLYGEKDAKIQS